MLMPRFAEICLVLILTGAPALAECTQPGQAQALLSEARQQINGYRGAAGLNPLAMNGTLSQTAQNHACDMVQMGRHSHTGSNGSDLTARLQRQGYRYRYANENVGKFNRSKAAQWWYGSSGHRANMLSGKAKEMGLGVALGPDGQHYWVMVSGARR
jgi:uncharacterized protein YkwD